MKKHESFSIKINNPIACLQLSLLIFLPLIMVLTSGCSLIVDARSQKKPFMSKYYSGDLKVAAEDLTKKSEDSKGSGDELMWRLDEATANFTASDYNKSLIVFERSEKIIKDFDDRAVISARDGGAELGVLLTNSNTLPYKGMYLDRIMLNAYKALDYFALNDFSGAQVELRRMRYSQKNIKKLFASEIEQTQKAIDAQNLKNQKKSRSVGNQNVSLTFDDLVKNSAIKDAYSGSSKRINKLYGDLCNPFASYFSAIGYLIDNNYSEAMVDFRHLYKMIPNNELIKRDYVTCAKINGDEIPSKLEKTLPFKYPLSKKIVYIILFNGRAPALKQVKFPIVLPYIGYSSVAFPKYEYFKSSLKGVDISLLYNKKTFNTTSLQIANFDSIMAQEYHQKLPTMITRIVLSTLSKEIASYAAVRAAREAGTGAEIGAYALTGLYKYLFSTADTRCWETLPQEIQATHVPFPDDLILSIKPCFMNHFGKIKEIKLKNDTNVAIVYIRALSSDNIIYKVFEQ